MTGRLATGSEISGYRVERLLGSGGQADVYLALDLDLGRPVALKLLSAELGADERFRERFLRESRLAASLDHPHVIPIYEAGAAEAHLFIAMRYVEGTDLRGVLDEEGVLPPERALSLLAPVADALDVAHARGLVHGDVKPSNVLVAVEPSDGSEHVYLSDFGLARVTTETHAEDRFTGSAHYTAPELILRRQADGRADVYALGCVLYECLTGSPPFGGRLMEILFAHTQTEPPRATERKGELPEALDGVIRRALAKEPDERFSTCRGLSDAVRDALGLERPRRSRTPLLAAIAGTVAVIAATIALLTVFLSPDSGEPSAPAQAALPQPEPILPLTADAVVRIEPETGTVAEATAVGSATGPLVFGEGSVWLADPGERRITQIDPATATVVDEIDASDAGPPTWLAVGDGAVFISDNSAPSFPHLWRYDVSTAAWQGIDTSPHVPWEIVTTPGALWAICCEALARIEPETGTIVAIIDVPGTGGNLIAADERTLWFADKGEGKLWRVDPATNAVVATVELNLTIADLALGEGALWILTLEDDLVRRVDPATNGVSEVFRVGRIPEALAVADGSVWVTSVRDGTVTRYELATADVETIDVGGTPYGIAAGGGGVWVAVSAGA